VPELDSFRKFVKSFPELRLRYLSSIGKRGRGILHSELLSGQELDLRAYPKDADGRHTISSKVNRRATGVDIRSYPANLFEKGRTLRDGSKEAPRNIITGKFARIMESRMQSVADSAARSILEKEAAKV
jgi:hypothetical protein